MKPWEHTWVLPDGVVAVSVDAEDEKTLHRAAKLVLLNILDIQDQWQSNLARHARLPLNYVPAG